MNICFILSFLWLFSLVSSDALGAKIIKERECKNGGIALDGECICPSFVSGSSCEFTDECSKMVNERYSLINPWNSNDVFYDDKGFSGCDVKPEIICCWQNKSNEAIKNEVPTNNKDKLARLLSIYGPWSEMDKRLLKSLNKYWGSVDTIMDYSDYVHVPVTPTPEGQKVKIAFILMVHANYAEHIPLLFESIYDPYHDYIIHVDSATSDDSYNWLVRFVESFLTRKTLEVASSTGIKSKIPYNNIRFTQQRIKGAWGSIALVYQNMAALSELLHWSESSSSSSSPFASSTWQHVVLLSAYDMPVKRISDLEEYLRNRRDTNFISVSSTTRLDRCQNSFQSCYGTMKQMMFDAHDICPFGAYRNQFYNETRYTYREGSQWTIITREFAQYLLKTFDGLETILSLKQNLIPDESFYQTAIGSSPFKHYHEWNALRYLPWRDGTTHPVVRIEDLDKIGATDYFTRKIADHNVSYTIYHRFIKRDE
eukprot:TRINITY_DN1737_c0_g1_i3.p1 TRINITY_DN1737_c0_g1~~TRINITY_DN1737_c0_g1_i3.p1  ORF type:complete len:483 (+),score=101.12 TRINITY_DN1737_c0_g1_i3:129-1577(+)